LLVEWPRMIELRRHGDDTLNLSAGDFADAS
jgi:hypothetical protein